MRTSCADVDAATRRTTTTTTFHCPLRGPTVLKGKPPTRKGTLDKLPFPRKVLASVLNEMREKVVEEDLTNDLAIEMVTKILFPDLPPKPNENNMRRRDDGDLNNMTMHAA